MINFSKYDVVVVKFPFASSLKYKARPAVIGVVTNKETIIKEAQKLLDDTIEYEKMSKAHNPYGDGKACKRIVEFIKESL